MEKGLCLKLTQWGLSNTNIIRHRAAEKMSLKTEPAKIEERKWKYASRTTMTIDMDQNVR